MIPFMGEKETISSRLECNELMCGMVRRNTEENSKAMNTSTSDTIENDCDRATINLPLFVGNVSHIGVHMHLLDGQPWKEI